jgi:hypothetical protein
MSKDVVQALYSLEWGFISSGPYIYRSIWSHEISPGSGGFREATSCMMEELHTDSIDGGHEASYGLGHVPGRWRTPTLSLEL